jgi:hypothetical protein
MRGVAGLGMTSEVCLSSAVAIGMVREVDLGLRLTVGVANFKRG